MVTARVHTERVQEMLKRKLDALQGQIVEFGQRSAIEIRNEIGRQIDVWSPVVSKSPDPRTNNLTRSFQPEVNELPFGVRVTVQNDPEIAPYARIHEKGGIIRPKKAKFLVFRVLGDSGPEWVKTKRVRIRRKAYLKKARQAVAPRIRSEWRKLTRQITRTR